eukprot:12786232-Alexandrium_andersonii.AAC.1
MSSVLASGMSCSPMSDIWSLAPSTRASGVAGPPPTNAGSDRPSESSCPGREPLEEAAPAPTADHGTGLQRPPRLSAPAAPGAR